MKKPVRLLSALSVLLAALAGWQWHQLDALREENGELAAKVRKAGAAAKMPPVAGRAAEKGGGFPSVRGAGGEKTVSSRPGVPERTPEERERFQKIREVQRAQRIESRLLALNTKLNLTPAQKEAVQAILEKGSKEREALREASFNSTDDKRPGTEQSPPAKRLRRTLSSPR
jgi:hypothetical protein